MPASRTFRSISTDVVRDFLSSVVVVDDRALLTRAAPQAAARLLTVPGRQGRARAEQPSEIPAGDDPTHDLDAKQVADAFAHVGVVCAILKPAADDLDTFSETLKKAARKADAVVLDWVLHEFKEGQKTLELIQALKMEGQRGGGRARLIIVYTGESDLSQVAGAIRNSLQITATRDAESFSVQQGPVRVCVYGKYSNRLIGNEQSRAITPPELPNVIVSEFAELTRGLISNVAIRSVAALRSNTYQLLQRFGSQMDAPYVTHRALVAPDDAANHLIPLIVSEIQSVLEDENVAAPASADAVGLWLKYQIERGLRFDTIRHLTTNEYLKGLNFLLKQGTSESALAALFAKHKKFAEAILKSSKKARGQVCKELTDILTVEAERGQSTDSELAVLMSVRSRYSSPPPRLSLGTIVCETKGQTSKYLLCVQPRCDSVRLAGRRAFPFLPMEEVADGAGHLIVKDRHRLVRLRLNDHPFEARMIDFAPATRKDREVLARYAGSDRIFKNPKRSIQYRWIADLRPEHAQRIANSYAHKMSRVGLAESEWLRILNGARE